MQNIIEANLQNFEQAVLQRSQEVPVLVDFWADWCNPCKMLTPVLEKLAEALAGKFILAKVNADENQPLMGQFGVRSLPTLLLFKNGQPVEQTVGVQPESAIRQMLEKHMETPQDRLRLDALALLERGQSEEAYQLLQQALQDAPEDVKLKQTLARVCIDMARLEEAETLLQSLPANFQAEDGVKRALARLKFARIVQDAPDLENLLETLQNTPDDPLARYQASAYQVLTGEYENALENLLTLMRKNRKFEDDAARKGLVAVFELLDPEDPLISRYRGKMSALLY